MDALGVALMDASAELWREPLSVAAWAEWCALDAGEWGAAHAMRVVMNHLAASNVEAARDEYENANAAIRGGSQ